MFKKLICAITRLTDAIEIATQQQLKQLEFCWLQSHHGFATRDDLERAKSEIIKAFGERVDPESIKELSTASDALEKAVSENQTKISGTPPG